MAKVIQLVHLKRKKLMIPTDIPISETPDDSNQLVLGDSADHDDNLTADDKPRNPLMRPSPVVELTPAQWEGIGAHAQGLIADMVKQKRVRKQEVTT